MRGLRFRPLLTLLFLMVLFFTVTAYAVASPLNVSSPTHPDENEMYKNDNPVLTWGSLTASLQLFNCEDVEVVGQYAYLAGGPGMYIVDIGDPANPVVVGTANSDTSGISVEVRGNYAYLVDMFYGLYIYDVSDPADPVPLGSVRSSDVSLGLDISGNYAYVGSSWAGLEIFNVSDPANPVLAGAYDTPGAAGGVTVSGDLAYVGDDTAGLQIINISDPTNPTFTGSFDNSTTTEAFGITVGDNTAYLSNWPDNLQILDISDPSNPSLIREYDTPGRAFTSMLDGSRLLVADMESGVQMLDVTNPAAPVPIGSYDTPGSADAVAVGGNNIYVADQSGGLQVVDDNPHQYSWVLDHTPTTVPDANPEGSTAATSFNDIAMGEWYFHVAAVDGGTIGPVTHRRIGVEMDCIEPRLNLAQPAYWESYADYTERVLTIDVSLDNIGSVGAMSVTVEGVSASNGVTACLTGNCGPAFDQTGSYDTPDLNEAVAVSESYAYVAQYSYTPDLPSGVHVIDVSDPSQPVEVGQYQSPVVDEFGNQVHTLELTADGSTIYMANLESGLQIFDFTDPANPSLLGSTNTGTRVNNVTLSGSHAFITDYSSDPTMQETAGLKIFDISDPSDPVHVGSLNTPGSAKKVVVEGNYAYIADNFNRFTGLWDNTLLVVDISDLANPLVVGSYASTDRIDDIAGAGGYLYMAVAGVGLKVFDISDPANPALVATETCPDYQHAFSITIEGSHAFIGGQGELSVFDISDPLHPHFLGSYPAGEDDMGDRTFDITTSGQYIYAVPRKSGLLIYGPVSGLPVFPIWSDDLGPGQSDIISLRFNVPAGVAGFMMQFSGSAQDMCGNSYSYGV